jgi:hypothetical protein
MNDLAKLNRLRVNAGMTELKSWKASGAKLIEKIEELEAKGHTDALPGARIDIAPTISESLAEELKQNEETVKQTLGESALLKSVDNSKPEGEEPKEKRAAKLARGLDTDPYAAQSRLAVRIQREKDDKVSQAAKKAEKERRKAEKKAAKKDKKKKNKAEADKGTKKKIKLSKADKQQIKNEAADRKIVGKVDEKKDPEKAKRQLKHIEDKQKARAEKKDKPVDKDNFTVADLARELDIDPKTARNKLRRHKDKVEKLHSKGQDGWTFPIAARKELTALLKGEK